MKAISIHQPWASWIAWGLKTIETREHDRLKNLVGQTIAIHAGLMYDSNAVKQAKMAGYTNISDNYDRHEHGAIIAIAKVVEARWLNADDSYAALIDCVSVRRFGLILDEIQPIIPIPYSGQQGAFNIPDDLILKLY